MRLSHFAAGAIVAVVPLHAGAATVEMRIDGDDTLRFADNVEGQDSNPLEGVLNVTAGAVAGYEAVSATVVQQKAPPFDQLLANVTVANLSGGPENIRIEVTGHFQNNAAGIWPGQFTATANDVLGSEWDIATYIGSAAYDTGEGAQIGVMANGALFAERNLLRFNANDYWITHVFDHAANRDNVTASASADASVSPDSVTPVPVPAAGVLLLGALGGLAAVRRRKG